MDRSMIRPLGFLIFLCTLFLVPRRGFAIEQAVALDIRWMGTDLIDEFVHDLEMRPPFAVPTLVTLIDLNAPVGLDERFELTAENHLIDLLLTHTQTRVQLGYCAACRKFVVKSTRAGTYMGRGGDQPELLKDLSSTGGANFGLSLNFEAEGTALVLRAQIFRLTEPGQPIFWSRSYSTSTASRLSLQKDDKLMSLAEAQAIQDDIIHKRDPLEWVSRVTMTMYSVSGDSSTSAGASTIAPLLFAEQSVEGVLLPRRNRRMAFTVGATSIDNSMQGFMVGGHFAQLLFRDEPSRSSPDLYFTLGFHYFRLRGPGAAPFAENEFDLYKLMNSSVEPRAAFVAYRLGVELYAKHRLGALFFIENSPKFDKSQIIANQKFIGIPYHGFGLGMLVKW